MGEGAPDPVRRPRACPLGVFADSLSNPSAARLLSCAPFEYQAREAAHESPPLGSANGGGKGAERCVSLAIFDVSRKLRGELGDDDPSAGIDPEVLAEGPRSVELAVVPLRHPELHSVAGRGATRFLEGRVRCADQLDPAFGNEPAPIPHPVAEMELAKVGEVHQSRGKAAVAEGHAVRAGNVLGPERFATDAEAVPQLVLNDLQERLAVGTAKDRGEHVGVGGQVVEVRSGGHATAQLGGEVVEILLEPEDPQVHPVAVGKALEMEEVDPGRHHHHVANRRLAVGRTRELRCVLRDRVVEALDRSVAKRHSDDRPGEALRGRPQVIPGLCGRTASVLLEHHPAAVECEEPLDTSPFEVIRERSGFAIPLVPDLERPDRTRELVWARSCEDGELLAKGKLGFLAVQVVPHGQ